jgi:amino acid transporter
MKLLSFAYSLISRALLIALLELALPVFVALSNLGNVLAVSFAHSRLNQEFAKEGLLPYSRFWASNKPFNAPAAAVSTQFLLRKISNTVEQTLPLLFCRVSDIHHSNYCTLQILATVEVDTVGLSKNKGQNL